jgi:glucans biosynthesis protein C
LQQSQQRLYFLDWLRVLVILNLVPFHAAWLMTFIPGFSHIDQDSWFSIVLNIYVRFFSTWHMPLLFFISGLSSGFILKSHTPVSYFKERVFRLLIPLLFFMVFLYPVLAYFWPIDVNRSVNFYFTRFWPYLMTKIYFNENTGSPGWGHMWFVAYLFIYSSILLPVFIYLKSNRGKMILSKLYKVNFKKGVLFLIGILFALVIGLLSVPFPFFQNNLISDWGYFTYNLVAFLLGYIFSYHQQFWVIVGKSWRISLTMGAILSIICIWIDLRLPAFSTAAYNPHYMLFSLLSGFNTWFWILSMLGISRKFLDKNTSFLKYFSKASYSFYIIHLVLMVVIGFYLVKLRLGSIAEFFLFTLISYIVILIFYEVLRRIPVIRFLLGMKSKAG